MTRVISHRSHRFAQMLKIFKVDDDGLYSPLIADIWKYVMNIFWLKPMHFTLRGELKPAPINKILLKNICNIIVSSSIAHPFSKLIKLHPLNSHSI
jgi:hypothetical protein